MRSITPGLKFWVIISAFAINFFTRLRSFGSLRLAEKLSLLKVSIKVAVSEEETLYGSIGTREIAEVVNSLGVDIEKGSIRLPEGALKELGNHKVDIELHPEVIHEIQVSIEAEE